MITFIEFLHLDRFLQIEIEEEIICAINSYEVDCTQWTWGEVKQTQDLLASEFTYKELFDVVRIETRKLTEHSDVKNILLMFRAIQENINKITIFESESMPYSPSAKEMAASMAVGGFEKFGTLPQTLSLCNYLNESYSNVQKLPYIDCINTLILESTRSNFQNAIIKMK